MAAVIAELQNDIVTLRLNSGALNPIGPGLLDDLSRGLSEAARTARGILLCGGEKFFSVGFDLPGLMDLDRPAMARFFEGFNQLCLNLLTVPVPTVCALSGHAVAGGNILALACDYRFAATGKKKIGLNEVKLGVPVPYLADLMLRRIVGDRHAMRMIYGGEFISFADAAGIGLVDETVPADALEEFSRERLRRMAVLPPRAFSLVKSNAVEGIKRAYEPLRDSKNGEFLDCWFGEPARELLREASKKF